MRNPKFIVPRNLTNTCKSKFEFIYESNQLKTKKGKNNHDKLQFQKNLYEKLKESNRNIYRTDVALLIKISIYQANAPSIQSVAKHYIDLICKTIPETGIKKTISNFKDDLQIKYLNVEYSENTEGKSRIQFTILSYHLFKERVHLVKWFNLYHKNTHNDYEENEDMPIEDESLSEYGNHLTSSIANSNDFEYWKFWNQRNTQKAFLHNNKITNKSIVDIFYPETPSQEDLSKPLERLQGLNFDNIIYELNIDTFQFNFGSLPSREGEGNEYKKNIKNQVQEYLKIKTFLFQL
ncbi:MAG: hypothetical protein IPO94_09540 [Saprospiraceae bacterium]|nr:hypothetical protein [Saprospiraceae bacterium]